LDRPIRDLDIFLPADGCEEATVLLRSRFGYLKVGEWRSYEMFSDPAVAGVAKFEKADETIPICLISLKGNVDPEDNIARFDFGVCMAAWTGPDDFITTNDFTRDIESKTFTLHRADDAAQFAYSMVRFKKLTADRYQGWELSVPSRFEELVKDHAVRRQWFRDGDHFGFRNYPQILRPKNR
jgi:hypothetical protein